jgi:hypothetical protein
MCNWHILIKLFFPYFGMEDDELGLPKMMIHFGTGWYGSCRHSNLIFTELLIGLPEVHFCKCDIVWSRGTMLRLCVGMISGEMFCEELNETFRFDAVV